MPNTWKVVFHRTGDRWPVLSWYFGDGAEKAARRKVAALAESGISARLFERVDETWRQRR